jgi:hypothetical protein
MDADLPPFSPTVSCVADEEIPCSQPQSALLCDYAELGGIFSPADKDELAHAVEGLELSNIGNILSGRLRSDQAGCLGEEQRECDKATSRTEELLSAALATGSFDMKRCLGKLWQQPKSSNQELVAAYAGAGSNYAQQRACRQKFVAEQLAQLKRTKSTSEEVKMQELTEGQYEPFDIIVERKAATHDLQR